MASGTKRRDGQVTVTQNFSESTFTINRFARRFTCTSTGTGPLGVSTAGVFFAVSDDSGGDGLCRCLANRVCAIGM